MTRRLRAVVCGTAFGQVYLEAFRGLEAKYELIGVHARGSDRSVACAGHYGVPLITDLHKVDADVACIVIRGGLLGGQGTEIAKCLMARGIHVLQEHPIHHDELAECLSYARRNGVIYQLNSFYPDLAPVRQFLTVIREQITGHPPVYVDAMSGFQVAFALLDIIGTAIGRLRPYRFRAAPSDGAPGPFRSLDGMIGGVPVTLRIENQLDPSEPDSYPHVLHRVTVGTESGDLTLVTTVGPIVWSARPSIPRQVRDAGAAALFTGQRLGSDDASALVIGSATAPSQANVFGSLWPQSAARALERLHEAVIMHADPLPRGQYHLTLCQMWQAVTAQLGPPKLISHQQPYLPARSGAINSR